VPSCLELFEQEKPFDHWYYERDSVIPPQRRFWRLLEGAEPTTVGRNRTRSYVSVEIENLPTSLEGSVEN
jgi:hypothetical protein